LTAHAPASRSEREGAGAPRGPVADFWRPLDSDGGQPAAVHCLLCPQNCHIRPGRSGLCRYRRNYHGELHATSYGQVSSSGFDPIEKKPLYHFLPGSHIFSAGTVGCNLACGFCQNWQISQAEAETEYLAPTEAARLAGATLRGGRKSVGIAYTYSEPLVWWEYVFDTAAIVHQAGLANILVTNGFIQEEPLRKLLPLIDAMNVDVKAFTDRYYGEVCHGRLAPVLKTVETAHREGVHVEVTTLLVPGLNDGPEEIEQLAGWLGGLDRSIPLHLSRYFPNYKMTEPGPTPASSLRRAREIARRHLEYVYVGNAFDLESADTTCPRCGRLVIAREGYAVRTPGLNGARCIGCGTEITKAKRPDPGQA
jgi:pyruvate formate lyase activating enzyme